MRFDGGAAVCKAVGNIIRRPGVMFREKRQETVGTQERIIRTNTDKAVEHIIFIAPVATDTCFTGNLRQYVILRAVGSGKDNRPTDTGLLDIAD